MKILLTSLNIPSKISFKAKIIDSHAHIGLWDKWNLALNTSSPFRYGVQDIDIFTKEPLSNGDTVDKMILSNADCLAHVSNDKDEQVTFYSDEVTGNRVLLDEIHNNPKLFALAVCQPEYGNAKNIAELISQNPNSFIGLKFHPRQLRKRADRSSYQPYLDIAKENHLPCLFHSDVEEKVERNVVNGKTIITETILEPENLWADSDPRFIYNLAKKYPTVPIILGHTAAGKPKAHDIAIDVLKQSIDNQDALLYCDISWMDWANGAPDDEHKSLKKLIDAMKERNATDRILFGTDAPLGSFGSMVKEGSTPNEAYAKTITKIKSFIRENYDDAEELIDKIFYKNAQELFFDKTWLQNQ